jgi:uncharacterized protein
MNADIQPILKRIVIYPIKSLDGTIVDRATISAGGALKFDRRWAIVDASGKVVNAKRTAKIQQLRSQFNFAEARSTITLQAAAQNLSETFYLNSELPELANWLSRYFNFAVSLVANEIVGFPDDLDAYGPTIVSTATLETICEWFPDLDLAEVRRRFRTNLELSGVPAFWEDRLFGAPGAAIDFQLGNVQFQGINPCQRCIVPTRDSLTGNTTDRFQQHFSQRRQQSLPREVNLARFNHFYRLAINTRIPLAEAGKLLNIGDTLV